LYWKANSLDAKDIVRLLEPDPYDLGISFRTAAERFHLIDDSLQKTIIVRYGKSEKLIEAIKKFGPNRELLRKLQRYMVNIYTAEFEQMLRRGAIEEIQPNIFALTTKLDYSEDTGLLVDETLYDPEDLIQ
jgi:CRISPR-associated endonuclease/helicase Cas3